jgi:hypothetical protein
MEKKKFQLNVTGERFFFRVVELFVATRSAIKKIE